LQKHYISVWENSC